MRLTLSGCLDIATAPQLDRRLRELEAGMRPLELDVQHVNFIDLRGLRVIHSRLLERRPWLLALRPNLGPCVRRLVELTGVELWPPPPPQGAGGELRAGARAFRTRSPAMRRRRVVRR